MDAIRQMFDKLIRLTESNDILLYVTATFGVVMPLIVYQVYELIHCYYNRYAEIRTQQKLEQKRMQSDVKVFYASQHHGIETLVRNLTRQLHSCRDYTISNLASSNASDFSNFMGIGIFVIESTDDGHEPRAAEWFIDWLDEMSSRKESSSLSCRAMHYAILGIDDSSSGEDRFCRPARILSRRLHAIGATQLLDLALADRRRSADRDLDEQVGIWTDLLDKSIRAFLGEQCNPSASDTGSETSTSTGIGSFIVNPATTESNNQSESNSSVEEEGDSEETSIVDDESEVGTEKSNVSGDDTGDEAVQYNGLQI